VLILGIDGGGVKTVCAVARADDGEIVGRGAGGPSNYLKEGLFTARASLAEAVTEALVQAKATAEQISVVCAGLAGTGRLDDRLRIKRLFVDLLPNARLVLETDAFIALVGATEYRPGLVVISGAGSIAQGINEKGEAARAGGWGHILGDEGSGYDIARRGLVAALHAQDGRGPETLIREKLLEHFYLASVDELISYLHQEGGTPRHIAEMYPLILEAAEEGDAVAQTLLESAAAALCEAAVAVVRRLSMEDKIFPVCLMGGVFRSSPKMQASFQRQFARKVSGAHVQEPLHPPEIGALLIARKSLTDAK